MKSKCHFCKKEYETYPILLCGDIECFLMEEHIKLIYYNREKGEGVCKDCRERKFSDPVFRIRAWLSVRAGLYCKLIDFKENKNKRMIKVCEDALERIDKIEKNLEKTPEVKALYRKNNPAGYKQALKNKRCTYCNETDGEVWINNPNGEDFQKEKCWWVCKPCKEVIEIQEELVFVSMGGNPKRVEELNNRLAKISKETGTPIFGAEVQKVDNEFEVLKDGNIKATGSKYKISSVEFTGEKEK